MYIYSTRAFCAKIVFYHMGILWVLCGYHLVREGKYQVNGRQIGGNYPAMRM